MKEAIELHLLADCKTRWNSLLQMLKQFLLTIYTEMLIGLVDILERMEIGFVKISVNDSSLLDVDHGIHLCKTPGKSVDYWKNNA